MNESSGINVLSLFNGLSCGHLALDKIGMKVDKYYSSEIDKHAIQVCQYNYPETVQLGDVTKWREWDIEWKKIDLVLAGSPCQGFSFAGKQLAFDDPRSKLFFVFVEILEYIKSVNPKVKWLLENVRMKKEHEYVISKTVGIEPIIINSALLSAQNRVRLYWTNFYTKKKGLFETEYCAIPQPKDLGIMLKDVLEAEVDEKYYISQTALKRILRKTYSSPQVNPEKTGTLNTKNNSGQLSADSGTTLISDRGKSGEYIFTGEEGKVGALSSRNGCSHDNRLIINKDGALKSNQGKASCFTAGGNSGGNHSDMDLIVHNMMPRSGDPKKGGTGHLTRTDGKTYCLDTGNTNAVENQSRIRRLTPTECARLQTIPDGYFINKETGKYIVSETQVYRQCGNGWTVDVIAYLLSFMNK